MLIENYTLFVKECKRIIKNYPPDESVIKISKLKIKDKTNKVGLDDALNIYKCFSDESVEWDTKKYKNDIYTYKNKVNNNIDNAVKYHDSHKKNTKK